MLFFVIKEEFFHTHHDDDNYYYYKFIYTNGRISFIYFENKIDNFKNLNTLVISNIENTELLTSIFNTINTTDRNNSNKNYFLKNIQLARKLLCMKNSYYVTHCFPIENYNVKFYFKTHESSEHMKSLEDLILSNIDKETIEKLYDIWNNSFHVFTSHITVDVINIIIK